MGITDPAKQSYAIYGECMAVWPLQVKHSATINTIQMQAKKLKETFAKLNKSQTKGKYELQIQSPEGI